MGGICSQAVTHQQSLSFSPGGEGVGKQVAQRQQDPNGTSQCGSQRDVRAHSCTFFSCVCVWWLQGWAEPRWPLAKNVRVQSRCVLWGKGCGHRGDPTLQGLGHSNSGRRSALQGRRVENSFGRNPVLKEGKTPPVVVRNPCRGERGVWEYLKFLSQYVCWSQDNLASTYMSSS